MLEEVVPSPERAEERAARVLQRPGGKWRHAERVGGLDAGAPVHRIARRNGPHQRRHGGAEDASIEILGVMESRIAETPQPRSPPSARGTTVCVVANTLPTATPSAMCASAIAAT